jgi:hypothetical protein
MSDPKFNDPEIMSYEPVEVHVGPEGCSDEEMIREYGEMNTGEWWNRLQVRRSWLSASVGITKRLLLSGKASKGCDYRTNHSLFRQNTALDV